MACFISNRKDTNLKISRTEEIDNVTVYVINVTVGEIKWSLSHRYSEFCELHSKLVNDHGVPKDILPAKKIIRNKCPLFIEKRREALEVYLKTVLNYLQRTMPRELAVFLDFHLYDVLFLLQDMALLFFTQGDALLTSVKSFTMTPIQLYAISERLQQPCPELCGNFAGTLDKRFDFSHVADFCSQIQQLIVSGSDNQYGHSNIIPNELKFNLCSFKILEQIHINKFPMENIFGLGTLRETLISLKVNSTESLHINGILLCDAVHKVLSSTENQVWSKLNDMDLSYNQIREIDESVKLVPNIKSLSLNHNKICEINNLASLPNLSHLYLSGNLIATCQNLHLKLGNILYLDLSENRITSLEGLSKLYSLEALDVSSNLVTNLAEINHISNLPCLENLRLTGNPVATVVDYRVKVLELFGTRASEVCLDNEVPSEKELHTVCVLQAIRIVKEGKTPTFDNTDSNTPLFILNSNVSS